MTHYVHFLVETDCSSSLLFSVQVNMLVGQVFFSSFCECEKQDLSADRALFSISINRCQHMPGAGLANTSHRTTFHQG